MMKNRPASQQKRKHWTYGFSLLTRGGLENKFVINFLRTSDKKEPNISPSRQVNRKNRLCDL